MNTRAPPVRLTERSRTLLEMRAAGYLWNEIIYLLRIDEDWKHQWVQAMEELGAGTEGHAIALAIRGGHIL